MSEDETLDGAQLSESVLAKDWQKPEEDIAWAHLQNEKSDLKSEI